MWLFNSQYWKTERTAVGRYHVTKRLKVKNPLFDSSMLISAGPKSPHSKTALVFMPTENSNLTLRREQKECLLSIQNALQFFSNVSLTCKRNQPIYISASWFLFVCFTSPVLWITVCMALFLLSVHHRTTSHNRSQRNNSGHASEIQNLMIPHIALRSTLYMVPIRKPTLDLSHPCWEPLWC